AAVLWYPSEVGPSHPSVKQYDGLKDGVALAKEAGLQVHAYFSVFTEGDADGPDLPAGEAILAKHPEWAVVDKNGRRTPFVCAGHEGYHDYLIALIDEVMTKYDLDGVHLDFVRYPRSACYCELCRNNIQERFGLTVEHAQWLLEQTGYSNMSFDERATALNEADSLIDYYCENVNRAITKLARHVRTTYPGRYVSAAVFPNPRSSHSQVFCDWLGFSPYLDFISPMLYFYSEEYFRRTVQRLHRLVGDKTRIFPGISALGYAHPLAGKNKLYHSEPLTFDYVAKLVEITREIGTGGFSIFHHATLFGYEPGQYTRREWGAPLPPEGRERFVQLLSSPATPTHVAKPAVE
ncbi:MAG: family 10 glycosylhydrolase, partial [Limnochordales bacterium]